MLHRNAVATTPPPPPSGKLPTSRRDLRASLGEIPVFPLPQAVLFPGAILPLHIFEPRYRQMTRDALDGARTLAVACLVDGGTPDAAGNPEIHAVAGVGVIVEAQSLPDGRYNLLLEGRERVRLHELPFLPPYRRARGEVLDDAVSEVPSEDQAALGAIATSFTAFVQARDPNFNFSLPRSLPAPRVADLCAHHLVLDAKERQKLLEMLDPAARVRAVTESLAVQLAIFKREAPRTLN